MTQGKVPEWARAEIQRIYDRYEMSMSGMAFGELVATLSQAYERGQESMRERAAATAETAGPQHYYNQHGQTRWVSELEAFVASSIRSLPIEQEGGK